MLALGIGILWLALGVIVVGGCIMLAFWGVRQVVAIPPPIEKMVWAIFGILCLIYVLMLLEGGGGLPHPGLFR